MLWSKRSSEDEEYKTKILPLTRQDFRIVKWVMKKDGIAFFVRWIRTLRTSEVYRVAASDVVPYGTVMFYGYAAK